MDPKLWFLMMLIGFLSALYHAGASTLVDPNT